MAARDGRHDLVKVLLDAGASTEVKDNSGYTALHLAAFNGDTGTIQLLLDAGLDLDAQDTSGEGTTALHEAAINLDATRLLLKSGANINAQNKHLETPLIQAADSEVFEVVRHLLNHHAKVNLLDENGDNVLHHAATGDSAKIAKLLLRSGADKGVLNEDGRTPLMVAMTSRQRSSTNFNYDVIEALIVQDESLSTLDPETGNNVLHMCLNLPDPKCVQPLLELDLPFSLDDTNDKGLTPLLQAIHEGHYKYAIQLIEHGANVNKKASGDGVPGGTTPLIWATNNINIYSGTLELVQSLLDAGANVEDINEMDYTPFTPIGKMEAATDESIAVLHALIEALSEDKRYILDVESTGGYSPLETSLRKGYRNNRLVLPHAYLFVEAGANFDHVNSGLLSWLFVNAVDDEKYVVAVTMLNQKGSSLRHSICELPPSSQVNKTVETVYSNL